MLDNNPYLVTWEKARFNLYRLQRRIFKSVCIGDFSYALKLQKLLISSNSARLVSIRFVTQTFNMKGIIKFNNDVPLTFFERFNINNLLLNKANSWNPANFREVQVLDDLLKTSNNIQIWSIPDRCWHYLVKFAIEPAHKALFSPRNLSFDDYSGCHNAQKLLFLNLGKDSFGSQKRILIFNLPEVIISYDKSVLLKKLLAPRSVKLGIYKFIKVGMYLDLNYKFNGFNSFSFLLANVLISDIDFMFNSVRVGSDLLVFLKPLDDEYKLIGKFLNVFSFFGIDGV